MKYRPIAYWLTTGIVAFGLLPGGLADLMHPPGVVTGMKLLGYPVYFMTILGFWKVLGGLVLLAPRLPRLKEWAYAGAFFDFTGAAASHAACGDYGRYGFHVVITLAFAVFTLASSALRPQSRRLGDVLVRQS
jgi:uncharacterized membrane protein YphA (DoxX/SURF4 family)